MCDAWGVGDSMSLLRAQSPLCCECFLQRLSMLAANFEQFPNWVAQLHKLGLEWIVQRRGEGGKYNITRRECGSLRGNYLSSQGMMNS